MHFNKQTVRALVAIVCVSVSANQLQAGFWDWFRCGKRSMPAATTPTAATAASMTTGSTAATTTAAHSTSAVTTAAASTAATHATADTKQSAQPQASRMQRFLNWLETKLNHHFSMQELSNSAIATKLFDAFGHVFTDVNDCQSYFTAHNLEEAQALRLYLAWQNYYAWEREHGTKKVVYLDTDTVGPDANKAYVLKFVKAMFSTPIIMMVMLLVIANPLTFLDPIIGCLNLPYITNTVDSFLKS